MKLNIAIGIIVLGISLLADKGESYAVSFSPSPSKNPKYPNHCYDSEANAYYEVSENKHQRVGYCQEVRCFSDFSWHIIG